tara:strand:+ start:158 stop:475 length:318 start_codon:yes stop_codon:yes gene_type:complete
MKNFKILLAGLLILILLGSCGTVKEAFSTQKKDNTDEFLVEKKNPLKLPPDFEELPLPNNEIDMNEDQNQEIKNLIKENEDNETVNKNQDGKNLEEFLLDKIKKN